MQQLYEHYTYNPDPAYLKRIYPLLKGAAQFCLDFMVKDPNTGYMVTCPASSPENAFRDDKGNMVAISFGSSCDNQLIRNLLRDCIEACDVLGTDADFKKQMAQVLEQLPPHQIGRFGQLQEWIYDFEENEVGHRHLSHLFAAYPDDDISLRKDPELIEAVRTVLKRRGEINRGWSGSWKINLHARLEEAMAAYHILHMMLAEISLHPSPEDSSVTPSFEGNQAIQGITAGVAEMLMQSHSSEISLLPALPEAWSNGGVEGLRARGGFDVSMQWKVGQLEKAIIKSNHGKTCYLRTKRPVQVFAEGKAVAITQQGENFISFDTEVGKTYLIK